MKLIFLRCYLAVLIQTQKAKLLQYCFSISILFNIFKDVSKPYSKFNNLNKNYFLLKAYGQNICCINLIIRSKLYYIKVWIYKRWIYCQFKRLVITALYTATYQKVKFETLVYSYKQGDDLGTCLYFRLHYLCFHHLTFQFQFWKHCLDPTRFWSKSELFKDNLLWLFSYNHVHFLCREVQF